jgi:hypothetical protein
MAWFDSHPDRLAIEKRLLKQHYPGVALVKKDGLLRIWISIRGRSAVYRCELVYPPRFPFQPMHVYIREPRVRSRFHQFKDGSPCLHRHGDVGPETTAVVYIRWLEEWIRRYEESCRTRKWRD